MNCVACKVENEAPRRFCRDCGAALLLRCVRCDFLNRAGDRFCGGCGEMTSGEQMRPRRATKGVPLARPAPPPVPEAAGNPAVVAIESARPATLRPGAFAGKLMAATGVSPVVAAPASGGGKGGEALSASELGELLGSAGDMARNSLPPPVGEELPEVGITQDALDKLFGA